MMQDLDYSRMPGNAATLIQNARLIEKTGQGLIVSTINGDTVVFSLSTNFKPIGHTVFNGVMYILSVNSTTGASELGCFPSPTAWSSTNTSFTLAYLPLNNYGGATKGNHGSFSTSLLGYTYANWAEIFPKTSWDNSVDLYICDNTNPNRIINTGFKITGEQTDRTYFDDQVNTTCLQFLSSTTIPLIAVGSINVDGGGSLSPGNIFLHIRYVTKDFNTTPFLGVYGPFLIPEGSGQNDENQGVYDETGTTETNKRIIISSITKIDESYDYFQIAVVRFYGSNNICCSNEEWLVDNYYPIDGSTYSNHMITGDENRLVITAADILKPPTKENICKTHVPIKNNNIVEICKLYCEYLKKLVEEFTGIINEQSLQG